MKKSLVITWIANCEYPLFRAWLEKHHSWFNEIIVCWDLAFRFPFYNAFIQSSLSHLPNIKFLDTPDREFGVEDWRDKATNYMIDHSSGDWIISIEQDWLCKDWDRLLEETEKIMKEADMTGWLNPTTNSYIHPAYWFIKRELLEKTGRDFSPHAEIIGSDHFAMITYKARELGAKIIPIQERGVRTELSTAGDTDAFHLGGVNQNVLDFDERVKSNTLHREQLFYIYNYYLIRANVVQSLEFLERCKYIEEVLKVRNPNIHPESDPWNIFFK